jgi:hypothetical protein
MEHLLDCCPEDIAFAEIHAEDEGDEFQSTVSNLSLITKYSRKEKCKFLQIALSAPLSASLPLFGLCHICPYLLDVPVQLQQKMYLSSHMLITCLSA